MASAAIASATDALSSLLGRTHLNDHEELLKAADAVLRGSKSNVEAQHVKVVALLKLDRYADALKVFEHGGRQLQERAPLEYAYSLYKGGRLEEAEKITEALKDSNRGIKHMQAQASYRAENFKIAKEAYHGLSSGGEGNAEEFDLRVNSGAVDAQLEWVGQSHLSSKRKPGREDLEAFETTYNAACNSIARGELGQAEVLLRRAKDLCNASELSDDEKAAELLPITIQQIYVLSTQGRTGDAEKLVEELQISQISDTATRQIAQINALAVSAQPPNPYMTHRLFHSTPELPPNDRLFGFQAAIVKQDTYVVDLLSHKQKGVAESTAHMISQNKGPSATPEIATLGVLNAAAQANSQTGSTALKHILPVLERRPNDVGLLLTVIHLYLLTNNYSSATTLLESFLKRLEASSTPSDQDTRFAPGLVGTLVSLYSHQGRRSQIQAELTKAASYWRQKSQSSSDAPIPVNLLKAAARELVASDNPTDLSAAGDIFDYLHSQDKGDKYAIAGLVAAYSLTAPEKLTQDHLSSLTPIPRLISTIDVPSLEAAGVARPAAAPASLSTQLRKRPADTAPAKSAKPKKPRKSKLPKDYDPYKAPDPERWLPMRDRSYYRPKGRKGKQKMAGLTQGGVEEARSASPAAPVATAGGGAGGKKKKGKGKK